MRRAATLLLLAMCAGAALACGKYGPPVRAEQKPATTPSEPKSEEATP
jgi:cytochrome c-type biogenesis protein CcmH/NrfG